MDTLCMSDSINSNLHFRLTVYSTMGYVLLQTPSPVKLRIVFLGLSTHDWVLLLCFSHFLPNSSDHRTVCTFP